MKVIKKFLEGSGFTLDTTGGVVSQLEKTGRLPPVTLQITPIENDRAQFTLDNFLSYGFNSNILVPVDTFEFTFTAPNDPRPFYSYVKEGDIVTLYANNRALSTGIIDALDIITDNNGGERVTVSGRDLMGQLEDHDAVSADDQQLWSNSSTMEAICTKLISNTRIQSFNIGPQVSKKAWLFATEPGESKLNALRRHLEFLNCLAWMGPTGRLLIDRPDFAQAKSGNLILSKSDPSRNNVLDISVAYNSTTIPNRILPLWSGQESVQTRVKGQALFNAAQGPSRLYKAGHRVTRSMVTSTALGSSAQDLASVNTIRNASTQSSPADSNILNAYAKREFAAQNHKERIVSCTVKGHYNENGQPYMPNQVYFVDYERGSVNGEMYLFSVSYSLNEDGGQITNLQLCNKYTIVADTKVL